jgi:hypothetical protein
MMTKRSYGRAYGANLCGSTWDIVIPNRGKVSLLLLKARFEFRHAAVAMIDRIAESAPLPSQSNGTFNGITSL